MTTSNMKAGTINLAPLYSFVKKDKKNLSINARSPEGRLLGKKIKEICHDIDDHRGFYIWGKYQKSNSLWRTIYLGKAMKGKTASLQARITEELKDERLFLWSKNDKDDDKLYQIVEEYYPRGYKNECKRACNKRGTTNIIWVSTPNIGDNKLLTVEADLIETLNPFANVQRPGPNSELQNLTVDIIGLMKHQIHKHRSSTKYKKGKVRV